MSDAEALITRLYEWNEKIEKTRRDARKAQEEQEVDGCTFTPTLIHKDLPAIPGKVVSSGSAGHFHERLYEDGPRIKQTLRKQKQELVKKAEEEEMRGCTFKPKVNDDFNRRHGALSKYRGPEDEHTVSMGTRENTALENSSTKKLPSFYQQFGHIRSRQPESFLGTSRPAPMEAWHEPGQPLMSRTALYANDPRCEIGMDVLQELRRSRDSDLTLSSLGSRAMKRTSAKMHDMLERANAKLVAFEGSMSPFYEEDVKRTSQKMRSMLDRANAKLAEFDGTTAAFHDEDEWHDSNPYCNEDYHERDMKASQVSTLTLDTSEPDKVYDQLSDYSRNLLQQAHDHQQTSGNSQPNANGHGFQVFLARQKAFEKNMKKRKTELERQQRPAFAPNLQRSFADTRTGSHSVPSTTNKVVARRELLHPRQTSGISVEDPVQAHEKPEHPGPQVQKLVDRTRFLEEELIRASRNAHVVMNRLEELEEQHQPVAGKLARLSQKSPPSQSWKKLQTTSLSIHLTCDASADQQQERSTQEVKARTNSWSESTVSAESCIQLQNFRGHTDPRMLRSMMETHLLRVETNDCTDFHSLTTKASSRKSQEDLCRRLSMPKFRYDAEPNNHPETSTVFSSSNTAGRQRPPPETPAQHQPTKVVSKAAVEAWVQEQMDRRAFHQEKLTTKREQEVISLLARQGTVSLSPQQRRCQQAEASSRLATARVVPEEHYRTPKIEFVSPNSEALLAERGQAPDHFQKGTIASENSQWRPKTLEMDIECTFKPRLDSKKLPQTHGGFDDRYNKSVEHYNKRANAKPPGPGSYTPNYEVCSSPSQVPAVRSHPSLPLQPPL